MDGAYVQGREARPLLAGRRLLLPPGARADLAVRCVGGARVAITRFQVSFTTGPSVERAGAAYKGYGINGRQYDGGRAPLRVVPAGAVEEWTISNVAGGSGNHVFHLHQYHFQVVGADPPAALGLDYERGDWRDTVSIPTPGSVTVRFRASAALRGRTLLHCHLIPHEDVGMMAFILVE
eukprot:g4338.t1